MTQSQIWNSPLNLMKSWPSHDIEEALTEYIVRTQVNRVHTPHHSGTCQCSIVIGCLTAVYTN